MAVVVLMHAVAVVVVAVVVVLFGGHLVALEQPHAQQQRQGHLPLHRAQDAGIGLDGAQLLLHLLQPWLLHQVAFVEQQDVAVHHLGSGHLPLQDLVAEVLRVDQGDDRIEAGLIAQVAAQEGHRHRQGIRQAGGLHHQVIHRIGAIEDSIHGLQQLAVDRAADAAVAELHHVVAGGDDQVVVDADLAEFVHQHRRFHPVLVGEDVVEQGGFARPEKTREDRHRQGRGGGIQNGAGGGAGHAGLRSLQSVWSRGCQGGVQNRKLVFTNPPRTLFVAVPDAPESVRDPSWPSKLLMKNIAGVTVMLSLTRTAYHHSHMKLES